MHKEDPAGLVSEGIGGELYLGFMREKIMGMSSHHSTRMVQDEWLTPPSILERLGAFDLDPCAPVIRPWDTATDHYTVLDDGLSKRWYGRVWMNPPYGTQTTKWLARLSDHGNGIALIFARTETRMFFDHVWSNADGLLFIEGRLFFHYVSGEKANSNSGCPSVLVAYGQNNSDILENCGISGAFVRHAKITARR